MSNVCVVPNQSVVWLGALAESTTLALSLWRQSHPMNETDALESILRRDPRIESHPLLVLGVVLTILGAALRIWYEPAPHLLVWF